MVIYAPFPFPQLCRPFRSGLTSAAKFQLISDSVKAVPAASDSYEAKKANPVLFRCPSDKEPDASGTEPGDTAPKGRLF